VISESTTAASPADYISHVGEAVTPLGGMIVPVIWCVQYLLACLLAFFLTCLPKLASENRIGIPRQIPGRVVIIMHRPNVQR
jgi:hypothetical protein